MRAVVIEQFGGPEILRIGERPEPEPGRNEVLVRVRAAGLNRADLLQRQGRYPAPAGAPQDIPGLEFAGEVARLGTDATRWRVGQRVFGITAGGAQAEYLVAHEGTLAEIPAELGWTEAAAVPEVFITAHDALVTQAGVRPGERVLIHAVGSGVGIAAVQLARMWKAIPYGTSRTANKIERAMQIGLEAGAAVREPEALTEAVKKWGIDFDVCLDLVGGPYLPATTEVMAPRGRIMLIGTVAGGRAELRFAPVMSKRLKLIGTVLRGRSLEEKIAATEAFARDVVPAFADGRLRSVIDAEFPLDRVADAHRRLESNESFGKIILRMD